MPNPVIDPGFEQGDAAWEFLVSAERRNDISAHGGEWLAYLFARGGIGETSSLVRQSAIPVTAGERRALTFWYRSQVPGGTQLGASVDYFGATFFPPEVSQWTLFVSDVYDVPGSTAEIVFNVPVPGSATSGAWEVDDVSLLLESELSAEAVMQRGKYEAYSALVDVLTGINGDTGGYYHDLSTRVRTSWQTPEEVGDRVYEPYLCLPFDGNSEQVEAIQSQIYKTTWRQNIYGYVAEGSSELATSSAIEAVCHLRDDILRALMADLTLGGRVRESRIATLETTAGIGLGYGTVMLEIIFEEWFTRDQLGPVGS